MTATVKRSPILGTIQGSGAVTGRSTGRMMCDEPVTIMPLQTALGWQAVETTGLVSGGSKRFSDPLILP